MNNLTRNEISEFINNEFGLTKKDCDNFVNDFIEEIINGLVSKKIVKIHNFGTFKLRQKKSRIGRNPQTKEEFVISARNVISFIPSKKVLDILNSDKDERKKI